MTRGRLTLRLALPRVLLFAAIGAAATVLVAWGSALPSVRKEIPLFPAACDGWPVRVPTTWPRPERRSTGTQFGVSAEVVTHGKVGRVGEVRHSVLRIRAGLPTPAFWGFWRSGPEGIRIVGLVDGIPLLPWWPGFLVDTAFWGGAAFVVWSVPGFVRRQRRRRRGRCVRCGYELKGLAGGAVCPECGPEGTRHEALGIRRPEPSSA